MNPSKGPSKHKPKMLLVMPGEGDTEDGVDEGPRPVAKTEVESTAEGALGSLTVVKGKAVNS